MNIITGVPIKDDKAPQGHEVKVGSVIIFPKEMSENDPLPFGVGRVITLMIELNSNGLEIIRSTHAVFLFDPKDGRFYFKQKPMDVHHFAYLSKRDDVRITSDDLIVHGFHVLTSSFKLTEASRELIRRNPHVRD